MWMCFSLTILPVRMVSLNIKIEYAKLDFAFWRPRWLGREKPVRTVQTFDAFIHNPANPLGRSRENHSPVVYRINIDRFARRLGIKESTVLSWARRYDWNLPKRKGGGNGKNAIALAIKPGDALIAAHEELEDTTKTGLMQALATAARQVAGKGALDVSNTAQLRDICLAAARIFGWKGESQVSVAVNADRAGVIVVTEEKRRELQERLKRLQLEIDSEKQRPAPNHPSLATNAVTGQRRHKEQPLWRSCRSAGVVFAKPQRPWLRFGHHLIVFLEAERVRGEPRTRASFASVRTAH